MTLRFRSFLLAGSLLGSALLLPAHLFAADAPKEEEKPAEDATKVFLEQAFSQATPTQVGSGVLLEKGALFATRVIEAGTAQDPSSPISGEQFRQAYHELRNGSLDSALPDLGAKGWRAQQLRHRFGAIPISLAAVDYNTLGSALATFLMTDEVLQLPTGPLGQERRFAAHHVWAQEVLADDPWFVVSSELLLANRVEPAQLSDWRIAVEGGTEQAVQLDVPFELQDLPRVSGELRLILRVRHKGKWLETVSTTPFHAPTVGGKPPLPPPPPLLPADQDCRRRTWNAEDEAGVDSLHVFDLTDSVLGNPFVAPWDEPFQTDNRGELFLRVIPGDGLVEYDGETQRCRIELRNPVVIVDGFDFFNNRGFSDIQRSFESSLKKLQNFGFDLILVDYGNGRDWIERNGEALREVLVDRIPDLVTQAVLDEDKVAVVAGSMGTQVARFALWRAEALGQDHQTGLFVAVDGPFGGSNLPIGFQAAAVDLSFLVAQAADFRDALESPAASQLLVRTYPRGGSLSSPGWYLPRPEFTAYTALTSGILPTGPRNVAAANGSGTGSPQTTQASPVELLGFDAYDQDSNNWISINVFSNIWADGSAGQNTLVYNRAICISPQGSESCWYLLSLTNRAVNGFGLDTAPGGYRTTTRQFVQALKNAVSDDDLEVSWDLDQHSFVSTPSAVGAGEPWDSIVYEKCNSLHGPATPMGFTLAMTELLAFRDGSAPPSQPNLYTTGCGVPEPMEYCYPAVVWYQDPEDPELIEPWADPVNCYVHPIPGGQPAVDSLTHYATEVSGACPDGSNPTNGGCPYFEILVPNEGAVLDGDELRLLVAIDAPAVCPAGTTFTGAEPIGLEGLFEVTCELPDTPFGFQEFSLVGDTIFGPPQFSCSQGIEQVLDGQAVCFYGLAPTGNTAFDWGNSFYYEGVD